MGSFIWIIHKQSLVRLYLSIFLKDALKKNDFTYKCIISSTVIFKSNIVYYSYCKSIMIITLLIIIILSFDIVFDIVFESSIKALLFKWNPKHDRESQYANTGTTSMKMEFTSLGNSSQHLRYV